MVPTALGFLGLPIPAHLPGIDLMHEVAPDDRVVFAEATGERVQWRAAIQGDRKWVVGVQGGKRRIVSRRAYDLAADPGEIDPKPWSRVGVAQSRLLNLVAEDPDPSGRPADLVEGMNPDAPKVAPGLSEEDRARLRALGYVR